MTDVRLSDWSARERTSGIIIIVNRQAQPSPATANLLGSMDLADGSLNELHDPRCSSWLEGPSKGHSVQKHMSLNSSRGDPDPFLLQTIERRETCGDITPTTLDSNR